MKTRGEIQEQIWKAITQLQKEQNTFKLSDIIKSTNINAHTVTGYLARLVKAGYIDAINTDPYRNNIVTYAYKILRNSNGTPRINKFGQEFPPTKRECLWRTMKMLKFFDYITLSLHASFGDVIVTAIDARDYIKILKKTGYLCVIKEDNRKKPAIYTLIRNTGAKPPQIKRDKTIYDPNLCEIVRAETV